ncbi:MAG TPA: TetR family transcriptional regulator [Acidimicrobiia bacterium]|nr:TetR family transcriptional regulator [Acidimicrobiia bacterium]
MGRASTSDPKRDVDEAAPNGGVASSGPRRSGLVQERSRRTRQQLVDAAVALWTERGFERGIEDTTVEEIVQAAGVTKGTFYFHFAHKEDILLEVGWGTSEAMFKEATRALAGDRAIDDVLGELLGSLARRITKTPRAAVARTLAEFYRRPGRGTDPTGEHFGFQRSFAVVFSHAQETGQLPAVTEARALGDMLESLTVGAIYAWTTGDETNLAAALRHRAALLLAGIRERDGAALA